MILLGSGEPIIPEWTHLDSFVLGFSVGAFVMGLIIVYLIKYHKWG